jgi:hypothetical protein
MGEYRSEAIMLDNGIILFSACNQPLLFLWWQSTACRSAELTVNRLWIGTSYRLPKGTPMMARV